MSLNSDSNKYPIVITLRINVEKDGKRLARLVKEIRHPDYE